MNRATDLQLEVAVKASLNAVTVGVVQCAARRPKRYASALLACVFGFAVSDVAISAKAQVVDSTQLDNDRVAQYQDYYGVTGEGKITEGYIRAPGDPIDYSPLLNDRTLRSFTVQTLMGCDPVVHYCDDEIYRWSRDPILIKLFYERQYLNEGNVDQFDEPIEYVLGATGIQPNLTAETSEASLIVYVGSTEYLWTKARASYDPKAIIFFELHAEKQRDQGLMARLLNDDTQGAACYTSNQDRAKKRLSRIYLTPSGLSVCFSSALLEMLDLYQTDLGMPSVTDASRSFNGLTHFDYFVFRLLEEASHPIKRDAEAIEKAWDHGAQHVRQSIDEDWFLSRTPEP